MLAADSGFEMNYSKEEGIMIRGEKIREINDGFLFSGVGDYALIEGVYKLLKKKLTKSKGIEDIKEEILDEFSETKYKHVVRMKRSKGRDPEEEDESIENSIFASVILASYDEKRGGEAVVISDDSILDTYSDSTNKITRLAIGAGDTIANAYLSRHLEMLSLEGGGFLAYKTIKDTMNVSAQKLMEPITIWVMDKSGIRSFDEEKMAKLESIYVLSQSDEKELFGKYIGMLNGKEPKEKSKNKI
ncbi:MAG: hypothetical protein ACP5NE_01330 [Candidatus Micrarchaeia archaeon]